MRYFYDLEFNDPGHGDIELVSIGIVCEDGREYYAVNVDFQLYKLMENEWMRKNVAPHLPILQLPKARTAIWLFEDPAVKRLAVIAREVEEFMNWETVRNAVGDIVGIMEEKVGREDNELWAYYGAYDHVVMCRSLWGKMTNLPANIPMWTHELMQLWELAGKPKKPPQKNEHHALADARWNRDLHEVCTNRAEIIVRTL